MIKNIMPLDKDFTKALVFLYGAGEICKHFAKICCFMGIFPDYICDKNSELCGKYITLQNGKMAKIISLEEMQHFGLDNPIIITNANLDSSICTLKKYGFANIWAFPHIHTGVANERAFDDNKHIVNYVFERLKDERSRQVYSGILKFLITSDFEIMQNIYEQEHYFPLNIIKLSDDEIFVDGGAYTSRTINDFINRTKGNFRHIYSFEPLPEMAQKIREELKVHPLKDKISLVEKAISDKEEVVLFSLDNAGSRMADLGKDFKKIEVKTVSFDDFFENEDYKPTYIKLDIEGAEMSALKGTEKIINKYRPKLAISIYHSLNDLWEIPYYLMVKYPFYDFYVRHHKPYSLLETVLYAVPAEENLQ